MLDRATSSIIFARLLYLKEPDCRISCLLGSLGFDFGRLLAVVGSKFLKGLKLCLWSSLIFGLFYLDEIGL